MTGREGQGGRREEKDDMMTDDEERNWGMTNKG